MDEIQIIDENSGKTDSFSVSSLIATKKNNNTKDDYKKKLDNLVMQNVEDSEIINDLQKAKAKVEEVQKGSSQGIDYEVYTKNLLQKINFPLDNQVVFKRLVLVVKSFLEKARNIESIKEILGKELQFGGLGLKAERIEDITKFLEGKFNKITILKEKQELLNKVEKQIKQEESGKLDSPVKVEIREPKKEITFKEVVHNIPKNEALINPKDALITIPKKEEIVVETKIFSNKSKNSPINTGSLEEKNILQTRSVGPIEELKYSFDDFRRLGKDIKERTLIIKEKIDLLKVDSLVNKHLGIRSWMNSEVFKNYIEIGEKSLVSKKTVDEIIDSYLAQGKNVLKKHEFEAVAEINASLKS